MVRLHSSAPPQVDAGRPSRAPSSFGAVKLLDVVRWIAAALFLGMLASAGTARADDGDVYWAMQDHPRLLLELRGVAEMTGNQLDPAGGGELAVGGWLGDFLAMELRAGLSFIRPGDEQVRAAYYGASVRARLADWALAPTLGGALLWHDRNDGSDRLGARGEIGLGLWAGDHLAIVLGATGTIFLYGAVGERAIGAFLGVDLLI